MHGHCPHQSPNQLLHNLRPGVLDYEEDQRTISIERTLASAVIKLHDSKIPRY